MKHAVLGVGAVGGLIATMLASLGEVVVVIVRAERVHDYPRTLLLDRPTGQVTAPVKVEATLSEPVDVLWIATKTFQLQSALESVATSPNYVVPLLNGMDHIESLRSRFGHERVISATIAVEAEKVAPGKFVQRSPFVRLNLAASSEALLGPIIAQLGEIGFTCQFIQNEHTLLWSKLCFLAPMALVSSASGMNKGEIFAHPEWKLKLQTAIAEACAVAKWAGAEVEAAKIQAFAESLGPGLKSSMQKDVEAHRPLELDAIAGPIVRGAKRFEIEVPTTEGLIAAIRAKTGAHLV